MFGMIFTRQKFIAIPYSIHNPFKTIKVIITIIMKVIITYIITIIKYFVPSHRQTNSPSVHLPIHSNTILFCILTVRVHVCYVYVFYCTLKRLGGGGIVAPHGFKTLKYHASLIWNQIRKHLVYHYKFSSGHGICLYCLYAKSHETARRDLCGLKTIMVKIVEGGHDPPPPPPKSWRVIKLEALRI